MGKTPATSPKLLETWQARFSTTNKNPTSKKEPSACKLAKVVLFGSIGVIFAYLAFGINSALFVFTAIVVTNYVSHGSKSDKVCPVTGKSGACNNNNGRF